MPEESPVAPRSGEIVSMSQARRMIVTDPGVLMQDWWRLKKRVKELEAKEKKTFEDALRPCSEGNLSDNVAEASRKILCNVRNKFNLAEDALRDISGGYEWSGHNCRERADAALGKQMPTVVIPDGAEKT